MALDNVFPTPPPPQPSDFNYNLNYIMRSLHDPSTCVIYKEISSYGCQRKLSNQSAENLITRFTQSFQT